MFKNESLSFCQQMQQNPKGILICQKNFQVLFLSAHQCQRLPSQTEGQ